MHVWKLPRRAALLGTAAAGYCSPRGAQSLGHFWGVNAPGEEASASRDRFPLSGAGGQDG